ncbi:ankyrin repeat domain-containing protein [Nocardia sp. NPDC058519]|uniref:ankyrin repeat domain-containing protein n=1 Tax=Nocardia sp. NPDC058519 TaxID=3346535 RepID=UPI00364B99F6
MHTARPTARGPRAAVLALAVLAVGIGACSADPGTPETAAPPAATATSPVVTPDGSAAPPTRQLDHTLDDDLYDAAVADDTALVRDLIARGADLETRGDNGRTPLVAATKNKASEAAVALIEAGADVNAKDDLQDSAYLYAGAEGLDQILAATLRHGADLRSVNRYGGTALIPASEHAHVSTVRMLIAAGVEVDDVNTPRWTALQEAIVYGDGSPRHTGLQRYSSESRLRSVTSCTARCAAATSSTARRACAR